MQTLAEITGTTETGTWVNNPEVVEVRPHVAAAEYTSPREATSCEF